jgi:hypothetical protein
MMAIKDLFYVPGSGGRPDFSFFNFTILGKVLLIALPVIALLLVLAGMIKKYHAYKEAQQRKACKEYAAFETTLSLLNVALNDHFPEAMQKKPWEQNRAEEQLDQDDLDEKQRDKLEHLPEELHFLIQYTDSPYYPALKEYMLVGLKVAGHVKGKEPDQVITALAPYCAGYTARFEKAIDTILKLEEAAEVYRDYSAGEGFFDSEEGKRFPSFSRNVHDSAFEGFAYGSDEEAGYDFDEESGSEEPRGSDDYPARVDSFGSGDDCFDLEKEFQEEVEHISDQHC